jgi:predicted  nucleic acid-binding Zn-ribbon protein
MNRKHIAQCLVLASFLYTSSSYAQNNYGDQTKKMIATVTTQLGVGLQTLKQMQDAPAKSTFGKDKTYYQGKMAQTLQQVSQALNVSDINDLNSQIKALNDKIKVEEDKIASLREQAAFGGKNAEEEIAKEEKKVDAYSNQIGAIKEKFRQDLAKIGIVLDDDQLDSLLSSVIADDFISMSVIFSNIGIVTTKLGELMQNGNEDLSYAKKYYGMYMLLLETLDAIQTDFINKIENRYIPAVNRIKHDANLNIVEAREGISSKRGDEDTLTRNISSNQLTMKAADLYLKQLNQQKNSIKARNQQIKKDIFAAQNTLKTVDTSYQMYGMMKKSLTEFDEVAKLAPPEYIVFDNTQVKEAFEKMTATIKTN